MTHAPLGVDEATGLDQVTAPGSQSIHLSREDGRLTLCGLIAQYRHRFGKLTKRCDRCLFEATKDERPAT